MTREFATIDERLDQLDAAQDAVGARLVGLEANLDVLRRATGEEYREVAARLDALEARVEREAQATEDAWRVAERAEARVARQDEGLRRHGDAIQAVAYDLLRVAVGNHTVKGAEHTWKRVTDDLYAPAAEPEPALSGKVGDERHPWYGPCDGFGDGGQCAECEKTRGEAREALRIHAAEPAPPAEAEGALPGVIMDVAGVLRAIAEAEEDNIPSQISGDRLVWWAGRLEEHARAQAAELARLRARVAELEGQADEH
jgi:hypothetical protein